MLAGFCNGRRCRLTAVLRRFTESEAAHGADTRRTSKDLRRGEGSEASEGPARRPGSPKRGPSTQKHLHRLRRPGCPYSHRLPHSGRDSARRAGNNGNRSIAGRAASPSRYGAGSPGVKRRTERWWRVHRGQGQGSERFTEADQQSDGDSRTLRQTRRVHQRRPRAGGIRPGLAWAGNAVHCSHSRQPCHREVPGPIQDHGGTRTSLSRQTGPAQVTAPDPTPLAGPS